MRVLGRVLQSCFLSHGMAYSADGEFTILHCNKPDTMEPEMKIHISKRFFEINSDGQTWKDGFVEVSNGYERTIAGPDLTLTLEEENDYISLDYQIQIVPQIIDGMSIGTEQNINFACHYSRFIDTEQSFDVTQSLQGATANGVLIYEASVQVSEMGDTRTLVIQPKHGLTDIYARVQQCRIYTEEKEVHPVHSMLNNELCQDSRIGTEFIRKVFKYVSS